MITVLLSTYNGERYLREQIDSILNQQDVDIQLLVRDDGSKDGTLDILEDYQRKDLLTYYSGENLGPQRAFMQMLKDAPESDFYAFADQDDFWKPEKLKTAEQSLIKGDAELYYCQTELVDENLQTLAHQIPIHPFGTFPEALIYKFVGGCTMVMTKKLRDKMNLYVPDYLSMHDVWVYSVALALGYKVIFDPVPHILYRQHSSNVLGQGQSRLKIWKQRWQRFTSSESERYKSALEIQKGFATMMPDDTKRQLDDFIKAKKSLKTRMRLLFSKEFSCASKPIDRFFRINLIFNTF